MAVDAFHHIKDGQQLLANMKIDEICEQEWNLISPVLWSLGQEMINRLGSVKDQVRYKLWSIESNAERMKYLYEYQPLCIEIKELTKMLPNLTYGERKNIVEAHKHSKQGDDFIHEGNFKEAIEQYSDALRHINFTEDEHGFFAEMLIKRCKAYFHIGDVASAFGDVEDGLKTTPVRHNGKFLFLGSKCLKAQGRVEEANAMLADAKNAVEEFQDEHVKEHFVKFCLHNEGLEPSNEQHTEQITPINIGTFHNAMLPGASDKLEIGFIPEKGRVVRATEEISKGSIVFSEQAIACWLSPSMYNRYCNYCLKALPRRYLPCRKCAVARFCSHKCESSAWTAYHMRECEFQDALKYLSYCHLALRLLIVFGIDRAIQVSHEEPLDISSCATNGFPVDYRSWHSLYGDKSYLTPDQLFMFCCGAMITTRIAEYMGIVRNEIFYEVAGLLLKHILQINLNCYSINDLNFREYEDFGIFIEGKENWRIGIGLYLGSSLISHSCDCNCTKYSFGADMVIVADRNIKPKEEITVTYAPHYSKSSFKDRKAFLNDHYLFDCQCFACENKMENVFYALKCLVCNGALIWNDDQTNHCLNCGVTLDSVEDIWQKWNLANDKIRSGSECLKHNQLKEAKTELMSALDDYSKIFYSYTRQSEILEYLCEIAEAKKDYREAFTYCMKLALIEQKTNGSDTMEAVCYLLRCADYLLADMKAQLVNFRKAARLKKIKKLFQISLDILQENLDRDFKTANHQFLKVPKLLTRLSNALEMPLP